VKIVQRIPVKIIFDKGTTEALKAGMNVKVNVKVNRK
jgi:multidrug resistance efflux pump